MKIYRLFDKPAGIGLAVEYEKQLKGEAMAYKQFILIIVVIGTGLMLAGCGTSNGQTAEHRRWDRVIEQARFDAVQESIEQGRLDYAILLLEDLVETNSAFADQAREMLIELRKVRQQFAQARGNHPDSVPSVQ